MPPLQFGNLFFKIKIHLSAAASVVYSYLTFKTPKNKNPVQPQQLQNDDGTKVNNIDNDVEKCALIDKDSKGTFNSIFNGVLASHQLKFFTNNSNGDFGALKTSNFNTHSI